MRNECSWTGNSLCQNTEMLSSYLLSLWMVHRQVKFNMSRTELMVFSTNCTFSCNHPQVLLLFYILQRVHQSLFFLLHIPILSPFHRLLCSNLSSHSYHLSAMFLKHSITDFLSTYFYSAYCFSQSWQS